MRKVLQWMFDVSLRPPRATYDLNATVCAVESRSNSLYIRRDVVFQNDDSLTLYGSLWHDRNNPHPTSCIIFLHSLGTNQFECINLIPFLCTNDLALFSFDFSGSGMSDGDTIPLVGRGSQDVFAAYNVLRNQFGISQIGLWGRSMGAAIGLDTVSISNDFTCIVSDSAFASTEKIIYDQAKINGYPKFLINIAKPILMKQAKKIVGPTLDISYPIKDVSFSSTPLLMGHGKIDSFVSVGQAQELFNKYGCSDKQLYVFNAKHNTARPNQWYEAAARFVYRKLGIDQKPRMYDIEYRNSLLHVGELDFVLADYTESQIAGSLAFAISNAINTIANQNNNNNQQNQNNNDEATNENTNENANEDAEKSSDATNTNQEHNDTSNNNNDLNIDENSIQDSIQDTNGTQNAEPDSSTDLTNKTQNTDLSVNENSTQDSIRDSDAN